MSGVMDEDYYTPQAVAEKFSVSVRTVRKWVRDGKLAAVRVGSRIRIPESGIRDLAQEMYGE